MRTFAQVKTPISVLALALLLPAFAFAHQPRIVTSRQIEVLSPEISKAYYGQLAGEPDVYEISATTPFDLYVGVLVPDILGQKKDVSTIIEKDGTLFATLDGTAFSWKQFFEEFGHDTYWQGPEFKARVGAGIYKIRVSSNNNDSKYSLAIGEKEAFDFKEGMNALALIPELKRNFFNESPVSFILSPFGWGLIVSMYLLAGIVGLAYRAILRILTKDSPRSVWKNIGSLDRVLRLAIGVLLLVWAVTTSWSPILLFFSGFALFEALFSWCGFYGALGKNSCPL